MPRSFANSTACALRTFAPASASSCVSSYERHGNPSSPRARRAGRRCRRRRRRSRSRSARPRAPRPSRPRSCRCRRGRASSLLVGTRRPGSPAITTTRPRASSSCTRNGTHLDDPRVDVAIVRDDARLAAGEADRIRAELADRHREERHRDALTRRQQHVELAALRVERDASWPARGARRWCRPSPTRRPRRRSPAPSSRITRAATWRMRSTSATLLPPYFWTTMGMGQCLAGAGVPVTRRGGRPRCRSAEFGGRADRRRG